MLHEIIRVLVTCFKFQKTENKYYSKVRSVMFLKGYGEVVIVAGPWVAELWIL